MAYRLTDEPNQWGCHDPQCMDSTWDHECPVPPDNRPDRRFLVRIRVGDIWHEEIVYAPTSDDAASTFGSLLREGFGVDIEEAHVQPLREEKA